MTHTVFLSHLIIKIYKRMPFSKSEAITQSEADGDWESPLRLHMHIVRLSYLFYYKTSVSQSMASITKEKTKNKKPNLIHTTIFVVPHFW